MDKLKEYKLGVTIGAGVLAAIAIFFVANGMVSSAATDLKPITRATVDDIRTKADAAPKQADVERRQKERDAMYQQVADLRASLGSESGQHDFAMQRWLPNRSNPSTTINDPATFTASLNSYVDDLQRHYRTFAVAVSPEGKDAIENTGIFSRGFLSSDIGQEMLQKRYWLLAEVVNALKQAIQTTRAHYQSEAFKAEFMEVLAGANPPGDMPLGANAPGGSADTVVAPDKVAAALYDVFYGGDKALPIAYIRSIDWQTQGEAPGADATGAYSMIPIRVELVASVHLWPVLSALLANPPPPTAELDRTKAVENRPGIMLSRLGFELRLDRYHTENQFSFNLEPFRSRWIADTGFDPAVDGDTPPPPRIDTNFDQTRERRDIRILNRYFKFLAEHAMGPGAYRIVLKAVAVAFDTTTLPDLAPADAAAPADGAAPADAATGG